MKHLFRPEYEKYWVLSDQAAVSGGAFITNLALAKLLGIFAYGSFSAVWLAQMFFLSITMSFSSQIYQVVFPKLNDQEKMMLTTGMLAQQVFTGIMLILLVSLLNMGFPALFATHLGIQGNFAGFWPILAIVLFLIQDFLRRTFCTRGEARIAFLIDMLDNGLQVILLLVTWVLHIVSLRNAWAIVAIAYIPGLIIGIYKLQLSPSIASSLKFTFSLQRNKTGWLLGSSLLQWGAGYFFVFAAGWWIGVTALGALRLAQYLFGCINLLLQAIENYTLPHASSKVQARDYWLRLTTKCALIIAPLLILLTVLARPIISLAGGSDFAPFAYVIYGLTITYIIITLGYPVRIAIRSLQMNREYFTAYVLSVGVSLTTAPWLLQHWQLFGVFTGLLMAQLINTGYWLFALYRKKMFIWKSIT